MQLLAFINESKILTDTQVAAIAEACTIQLARHVCPAWRFPTTVCFPRRLEQIHGMDFVPRLAFFDQADDATALGYHDKGPDGLPYGKVFVAPILSSGGSILQDTKGDGNTVGVCGSHEATEMVGSPSADDWDKGPARPEGDEYAHELCDMVQADSYPIATRAGIVSVSNFALPAFFGANGRRFDFLGKLSAPWTVDKDGYLIIRDSAGSVRNIFGKSRHAPHPASRLARRGG